MSEVRSAECVPGKSLLLVAYYPPERGTGGGLRLLDLYRLLARSVQGLAITLLTCDHGAPLDPELSSIFKRVVLVKPDQFCGEGIRKTGVLSEQFDVVDLEYLQAGDLVGFFKAAGTSRVVVSPMESHVRAAGLALRHRVRSVSSIKHWLRCDLRYAIRELRGVWSADRVMCVSADDAAVLRWFRPWGAVCAIETGVSEAEFKGVLQSAGVRLLIGAPTLTYLAYFGSQTNMDALGWYLENVHPSVKASVPGYRFRIVGRGLSAIPATCGDEAVDVIGEVDSLQVELARAWVGIAPALGGAGMRGKINQYAIMGVPCVASVLAGKGFAYESGKSIRLADDADQFASACIDLLTSPEYNREMGAVARQVCLDNYCWESRLTGLRDIFSL